MSENRYHFERLTPTDDVNLEVYEEAIDYVFNNPDVRNVAISGAYSAGKSSVLASYKKKHSDKSFLHISLAHFQSPNEKNKKDEKKQKEEQESTEVKESVLEGKILNQLIHQIPSKKIPQTNFRVKKRISNVSIIAKTVEIVFLLIAVIYFLFFDSWKNYVSHLPVNWLKTILELSAQSYALMVDGIVIIILASFIVYGLIKIQKNKNVFRKLNLQGNEIEIFEESDDSYFDKYLNEVLYLFENADADVIVFEDMDRFNANKIFERLREVNALANIHLQKENKKVLRFFYLLRDDIFVSKDRTKFFDFIMPVVPVVDGSNSYDQFISHFKKGGLFEKFDESFLQGLSLYIDDMRLLKNIYNEFVIYYNRLNITELDCNKMLAIIVYKNLFPRDFADLQINQGFVYTLFAKKDEFIKSQISALQETIKGKEELILLAQKNHLQSVEELNILFAEKYLSSYSWRSYSDKRLQEFISEHLRGDALREYKVRKEKLEILLSMDKKQIQDEIFLLGQRISSLKNQPLSRIITRDNTDKIFKTTSTNEIGAVTDFKEIKSSEYFDLLKYLICYGRIDETYADYMTYFYENSLSRIDKTFLRSVTDKKAKEYTYQLKNPALVISRLRLVDFEQEEILNFSLLTYLLHSQSHIEYLERFLDQLRETKNFKFIGAYFDDTAEISAFIKNLNIKWPELFNIVLEQKPFTERQIHKYSVFSIYYSDDDTIKLINQDNCLCNYISNARDYLAINEPDIDKLIHGFKLLGVRFVGFDYGTINKDLLHSVYEESLYEINAENLRLIQREFLGVKNDEDIVHKNYTLLISHPDSAITQYVNQNINEYFDVVLQMSEGTIHDDENVAIAALNNPDLTVEHKHLYISVLQTTIICIREITDRPLWSPLLDADIVQYSETNIIDCFSALKLNESVISYINRCTIDLDFSKLEFDDAIKEKLFDSVIICDSIENSKYKQILVSLEFYYDTFKIADISNDKFKILINTNIIRMTTDNLKFLRENYPNQKFDFIRKNIERYIDIMDSDLFLHEELLEILTWDISDELKIKLLKFSNNAISVIGKNYSVSVCLYILNNNLMDSDLMTLFSSFEQWDDPIQTKIFDYAVSGITNIIDNPNNVSEKLKHNLLYTDRLSKDIRTDLLIAMMPVISEDYMKEALDFLNLNNYIRIFDARSRPKFEISDESEKLLTAFREKGLIHDYEESQDKKGYYKIVRTKQAKPSV